jgi:hypothetical protein
MQLRLRALVVVSLAFLAGCAGPPSRKPFYTRIYDGSYDEMWASSLKALADYPLKLSNKDTGRITTEVVNGPYNDLLFQYPEKIELPERFRYSLDFNFAKLIGDDKRPLTRVRVVKNLERFQDFYTGWTPYGSDGIEEQVLLYRMEHLLKMEKTLARVVQP